MPASTHGYSEQIAHARRLLHNTENVLVGVASGLSAAGGLNYFDAELVGRWFPEYYMAGFRSLPEIQSVYWEIGKCKPEQYWGYWARHIDHIRYEAPVTKPYLDLKALLDGKNYFITSTNADGQLEKAGYPKEKIFAPQGDYQYFQCAVPCRDEVFENEAMIRQMVDHMPSAFEVRTEDIPKCPYCGAPLVPNLRCGNTFVEAPHMWNAEGYSAWLGKGSHERLLLLELGVGFQTPVIIRFPFEQSAMQHQKTTLVRVNLQYAEVPKALGARAIGLQADIAQVLKDLVAV